MKFAISGGVTEIDEDHIEAKKLEKITGDS
jgi:hypothetical protein